MSSSVTYLNDEDKAEGSGRESSTKSKDTLTGVFAFGAANGTCNPNVSVKTCFSPSLGMNDRLGRLKEF